MCHAFTHAAAFRAKAVLLCLSVCSMHCCLSCTSLRSCAHLLRELYCLVLTPCHVVAASVFVCTVTGCHVYHVCCRVPHLPCAPHVPRVLPCLQVKPQEPSRPVASLSFQCHSKPPKPHHRGAGCNGAPAPLLQQHNSSAAGPAAAWPRPFPVVQADLEAGAGRGPGARWGSAGDGCVRAAAAVCAVQHCAAAAGLPTARVGPATAWISLQHSYLCNLSACATYLLVQPCLLVVGAPKVLSLLCRSLDTCVRGPDLITTPLRMCSLQCWHLHSQHLCVVCCVIIVLSLCDYVACPA
jgi:hypothetical protein